MTRSVRWSLSVALVFVAVLLVAIAARPYLRATSFIARAAGVSGAVGRWAHHDLPAVSERPLTIAGRRGSLRARVYRPAGAVSGTVLVFAGVHPSGIDEPRLIALARELAQTGLLVVTPELPDLVHLQITPASVDAIEDAAGAVAGNRDLAPGDGRVGLIGISFSGALATVAAGRASVRDRVAYVLSFGGYGDLPRVLRYLCTGTEAAAAAAPVPPPHDYGVAIVLYGMAAAMVPPDQVNGLRRGIAEFIDASATDSVDHHDAGPAFAAARRTADAQPEPARTLLEEVNDRAAARLGAALAPRLAGFGADPALSPERSPVPAAPVFLLHGTDDNVIPAIESVRLDAFLRTHGVRTRLLLSTLISHAEVDKPPSAREVIELVRFWAAMFELS